MGRRVFGIAIPMLMHAGGGRVLLLRNDLEGPLMALRGPFRKPFSVWSFLAWKYRESQSAPRVLFSWKKR